MGQLVSCWILTSSQTQRVTSGRAWDSNCCSWNSRQNHRYLGGGEQLAAVAVYCSWCLIVVFCSQLPVGLRRPNPMRTTHNRFSLSLPLSVGRRRPNPFSIPSPQSTLSSLPIIEPCFFPQYMSSSFQPILTSVHLTVAGGSRVGDGQCWTVVLAKVLTH